jgi:hypothetical protein
VVSIVLYCINYRAALKADIGTQVVADDPYFGGKVSFKKMYRI